MNANGLNGIEVHRAVFALCPNESITATALMIRSFFFSRDKRIKSGKESLYLRYLMMVFHDTFQVFHLGLNERFHSGQAFDMGKIVPRCERERFSDPVENGLEVVHGDGQY